LRPTDGPIEAIDGFAGKGARLRRAESHRGAAAPERGTANASRSARSAA